MSLFVVDVEADGPCPGLYSMVSFAVVRVQPEPLDCVFYGETAPISERFIQGALDSCRTTREQHLGFERPESVMPRLVHWLQEHSQGRPVMVSDNPAFDFQFICYYLHAFAGDNPFGHSARRIGDLYAGLVRDFRASSRWKSLRKTKHTHHPVDDAKGNVEALLALAAKHQLTLPLPTSGVR